MLSGHAAYCFATAKPKFPEDRGTPRVKYMWQPSLLVGVFTSRIHGENVFLNFLPKISRLPRLSARSLKYRFSEGSGPGTRMRRHAIHAAGCFVFERWLPELRTTEAQFLQPHFTSVEQRGHELVKDLSSHYFKAAT